MSEFLSEAFIVSFLSSLTDGNKDQNQNVIFTKIVITIFHENVPFGYVVRLRVSRARALCFSKLMIHRNPLSNFTNIKRISSLTPWLQPENCNLAAAERYHF